MCGSEEELAGPGMAEHETWRRQLEEAEKKYEEAALQLQAAIDDGRGVDEARQQKATARAEYLRLLRIFSDLVLRGKAPGRSGPPQQPKN
jgi:hypothetical protein